MWAVGDEQLVTVPQAEKWDQILVDLLQQKNPATEILAKSTSGMVPKQATNQTETFRFTQGSE